MPTYEYRCTNEHRFEKFQRMSDAPVTECPECGAVAERLLSAGGGLIFKGSGFYITDYRNDSYKKAAEKDTGVPAPAESKTDAAPKKDGAAKPATEPKAEPKPAKKSDVSGKSGS